MRKNYNNKSLDGWSQGKQIIINKMEHISMVNNKLIRLFSITSIDELMCFWKFNSSALFTVPVIIKFLTS